MSKLTDTAAGNPAALSVLLGRYCIAVLFAAGVVQKWVAPDVVEGLLIQRNWPAILIWPAMVLNALGVVSLITGIWLGPTALVLALYCMVTSLFHFLPDDPWQMSIVVKNWAIAGGLLVLFGHETGKARPTKAG